ncbi:MAG: hypothetical protein JRM88_06815 [Nitrososphaerota archaeon]|jgi:hypothetical protein|nr:hypothetical protein [Nitrososphaerota archaeon]
MGKTKVTLSVDDALLRESKGYLAEKNLTISGTLERALSEIAVSNVVERVASGLGEKLGYVGYDQVPRKRPKGKDAAKIIGEARGERVSAISR